MHGTSIELRNVSRWYGNVVAVNDITMTIGPGVTGLLGPNGAGKSTILHMIAGFLAPSKGEAARSPASPRGVTLASTHGSAWFPSATPFTPSSPASSSSRPARSCTSCLSPSRPPGQRSR